MGPTEIQVQFQRAPQRRRGLALRQTWHQPARTLVWGARTAWAVGSVAARSRGACPPRSSTRRSSGERRHLPARWASAYDWLAITSPFFGRHIAGATSAIPTV